MSLTTVGGVGGIYRGGFDALYIVTSVTSVTLKLRSDLFVTVIVCRGETTFFKITIHHF